MSDTTASDVSVPASAAPDAPTGLFGRAAGVLTTPRATYAEIAARPRWLAILLAVTILCAATSAIFLSTEVGRQALLDQQVRTFESFGRQVTDAQYRQFEQLSSLAPLWGALFQAVGLPLVALAVAGLSFGVFKRILGGHAAFRQVLAVTAHSTVILALRALVVTPLNYARETMASPTSLAAFVPFLDDTTIGAHLLGSLDLFYVWWLLSLSIGLAVLYARKARWVALAVLAAYAGVLALLAVGSVVSGA
jgi:hypothetical protein